MRLLLTRAQPDADTFAARLADAGIESVIAPVFEIRPTTNVPPDLDGVAGLLFTSANGVRALADLTEVRNIPAYAVGDATARAAEDAGYSTVTSAGGDVVDLASMVRRVADPRNGALFHGAGQERAGDLRVLLGQYGFTVRRETIYRAAIVDVLPEAARTSLRAGVLDGVIFFSPRTAEAFVRLVLDAGVEADCAGLVAYCLSEAVADALTTVRGAPKWRERAIAMRPTGHDLYKLILSHSGNAGPATGDPSKSGPSK